MLKKSMFFEISHIEYTPSVAKSSLASFLESIKDPETKKIIERIFDLIPDSLIEYRSDIEKRVIEKIDIYQSELERLKKDVITNDATEDLPNLSVSESNPLNLKVKLLIDLETIYSEVKRKSLELAFINEIHGYKALLDGTIELEKKDTTTPEGRIAFIVNVSSRYGVESLKDELNKLLEQTEERVNITANSESFQGNVSDLKTSFNIDLMALYNMARHYQKYYDSLFDLENSELAKDISIFKRIISSLDDEAPSIYNGLLEELLDKYKKFGINMDREEYEKNFRKELERMLEKVGTKISSIETHRNILMGINNSLKTLVEGQAISNPHNTIESMVNDILELLKTSLLEKETAQQYREKLKELLESLYAQNLKDEQKESNPNTLSDPLNCPSNLHIFKENILLEIEALKALAKLKYEIEFDLMKLQHIDKYKL